MINLLISVRASDTNFFLVSKRNVHPSDYVPRGCLFDVEIAWCGIFSTAAKGAQGAALDGAASRISVLKEAVQTSSNSYCWLFRVVFELQSSKRALNRWKRHWTFAGLSYSQALLWYGLDAIRTFETDRDIISWDAVLLRCQFPRIHSFHGNLGAFIRRRAVSISKPTLSRLTSWVFRPRPEEGLPSWANIHCFVFIAIPEMLRTNLDICVIQVICAINRQPSEPARPLCFHRGTSVCHSLRKYLRSNSRCSAQETQEDQLSEPELITLNHSINYSHCGF